MRKLKIWQIIILVILWPIGLLYLIYKGISKFQDKNRKYYEEINSIHSNEYNSSLDKIKLSKQFKTDLVEVEEHHPTCGECAKYQGRVFSISGKSKKFPKLPDVWYKYNGFHQGCRHSIYPYFDGVSTPTYHKNIVSYSNRPFIDNRTDNEKQQWIKSKKDQIQAQQNIKDYDWIRNNLKNIAPKSLSGYSRMKNLNSNKYNILVKEAKDRGYDIK